MPASKAQQAVTAERRAKALALRVAGATLDQIAEQLGYADRQSAGKDIDRAIQVRRRDLSGAVDNLRPLEVERLDAMERAAWGVLRRTHTLVSQGRVIRDEQDRPMTDDGPVLDAIDRLLKIQARRARLLGLDAPTKVEVISDSAIDDEIRRLTEELGGRPDAGAPGEAADAPGVARA